MNIAKELPYLNTYSVARFRRMQVKDQLRTKEILGKYMTNDPNGELLVMLTERARLRNKLHEIDWGGIIPEEE